MNRENRKNKEKIQQKEKLDKIVSTIDTEITKNTQNNLWNTIEHKTDQEIWAILEDYFGPRSDLRKIFNLDFIKENNIGIWDILSLCGFNRDISGIYELNIYPFSEWINKQIIYVKIKSTDFDNMNRIIDFKNKEIILNRLRLNKIKTGNWIGTESLTKIIKSAKEEWFKKITLKWGKQLWLEKEYKSRGYSFYPNRWFLATEKENTNPKRIKKIRKAKDWRIIQCNTVNELFSITDEETGEKIWLKYRKKIGDSIDLEMEL